MCLHTRVAGLRVARHGNALRRGAQRPGASRSSTVHRRGAFRAEALVWLGGMGPSLIASSPPSLRWKRFLETPPISCASLAPLARTCADVSAQALPTPAD